MFAAGCLLTHAFATSSGPSPRATVATTQLAPPAERACNVSGNSGSGKAREASGESHDDGETDPAAPSAMMLGVLAAESALDRISDLLAPLGLRRVCWTPQRGGPQNNNKLNRSSKSAARAGGRDEDGDPVTSKQKNAALYTASFKGANGEAISEAVAQAAVRKVRRKKRENPKTTTKRKLKGGPPPP